ncbi:MAG: SHD1 domain-containing protein [Kiritimatiellae bacterium]|nr:SHD1 domain-containing protein [Kiritimatiellia bacterium]
MNARPWVVGALLIAAGMASGRTWTSVSGSTVEAEFKALQGTVVILEGADGRRMMIPLSQLSPEDQQFVREQTARPATPPATPPPRHGREPRTSRTVPVPSSTPAVLTGPASARKESKDSRLAPLPESEIAALKRQFTDERTGDQYEFLGGASVKHRLGEKDPDWKEGDPIPLTITCELVRVRKKKDGTSDRKREDGTAEFYVADETGAVVFRRKERLSTLEPEPGKGYIGELPKPGKYTLVIWTELKDNRLGLTETIQARPPTRN